jgi:glycosyltransferase involved in cell wall biosynthesis
MVPLISVVIPIYKVEKYLNRCIDSVLAQAYRNLEIILVDDGSPDQCGDICESYKAIDPRVIVFHKENGGLSDARNFGIDKATGEFVTVLDSDDWLAENFVSELYSLLQSRGADISVSNFFKAFDNNTILPEPTEEQNVIELTNVQCLEGFKEELAVQMIVAWGKLYRRTLFEGIRYPKGRIHEDEATTYKLIYAASKIVYTPEPLLFYFQRSDSIMGRKVDILPRRIDFLEAIFERADFSRQEGLQHLSDHSYRTCFEIILNLDLRLKGYSDQARLSKIQKHRQSLRKNLRAGFYGWKFRLFFEFYYLAPQTAGLLYKYFR